MMLPTPHLDDRRFQDLVDDAKRRIQATCPEWTDHNVSDPGVTLVETFAHMVDELSYRLNRVPDRLFVTFLELIGVQLQPPSAARADLTYWLSAPQPEEVRIPAGTAACTPREENEDPVVFATTHDLVVPPRTLTHVLVEQADGDPSSRDANLREGDRFSAFTPAPPRVGDALLVGLDDAAPGCIVSIHIDAQVEGRGVDPRFPPLRWEAWAEGGWRECELDSDGTGGLNRSGEVVLHLPALHETSVIAGERAGWLRCRVIEPDPGYPTYSASPTIAAMNAVTVGGTVPAVHAETITEEILGLSEGTPGQVFRLAHAPVVPGDGPFVLEVAAGSGWREWTEVDSFAGLDASATVFRLDRATGELHFPPAVREADGSLRTYGDTPPKGAPMRVPSYRTGGGPRGNVAARTVVVMSDLIPLVSRVENRRAGFGGVAAETVDQAMIRGPITLRTRDRAVTAEDYEELARQAAPSIARVRCVVADGEDDRGGVRLLVVPAAVADDQGRLALEDLIPSERALARISSYLDERRPIGARLLVEPPFYQGVTVVARILARPRADSARLEAEAVRALNYYFDPLTGGPDATGWPFGRPVQAGEVYAVLQRLPGLDLIEDVKVFGADPLTGKRGEPTERIAIDQHGLVFSYQHQVRAMGGR
ncbi:putative baseplate assembly protein [Pseudactinotalea sp. HY160]|nr:putative baseplate assembly protein [Pseudactinotalea sp. HY160]